MSNLNKKRFDAGLLILGAAAAGGFSTFTPTPGLEIPKQIALTGADFALCIAIWKIYFNEELSDMELKEVLEDVGIVTVITVGAGYTIAKGATGLLNEALNLITLPGWIIGGAVASCGTAVLGFVWMAICDKRYREDYLLD